MPSDDEQSNSSARAASEDEVASELDDLFGDGGGSEEEQEPKPKRRLDDEELDSGDDEGRDDRMEFGSPVEEEPPIERELQIAPIVLPRHPVPEPSDNELYLLKVPPFLSMEPHLWQAQKFQTPATHHHSKLPPTASFSAYDTAMTTVRWRHSPSDPEQLQSNARILRWSDGSLTLQLASDPTAQYQIAAKPLAPPQSDPPKPVPMAAAKSFKSKAGTNGTASAYDPKRDTFSYLAEPSEAAYVLRVTRHFTTALDIKPNSKTESLESLQVQMSAAVSKYQSTFANDEDGGAAALIATGGSGLKIEDIRDDPEKLKKEALRQEREMERKIRKEERDREKNMKIGRATGRFGGVGLSMEGLEGESGSAGGRRGGGNRGGARNRRSRRDEFSEEEEELYGRRGGPEDQYDMDDGFLASDDDEDDDDETGGSEDAEGEEDIDDVIERQEKQRAAEKKKSGNGLPAGNVSPKRRADNEDAADGGQDSPQARAKRRRVVDSEDESE